MLSNGFHSSESKGTVWFSDVKLEENAITWELKADFNRSSIFEIDNTEYYGNSGYSVKITNPEYNTAYVGKTFEVKPNTMYRFSAWTKCEGFESKPTNLYQYDGAIIGFYGTYENISRSNRENTWKKLYCDFNSGDTTPYKYNKTEIGNAKITFDDSVAYTGKPVQPDVKVYYDGKTLSKGTDYTLTYVKEALIKAKGIASDPRKSVTLIT
ncbi:MAG: hypothetical protein IJ446_06525 [Oscillospiraceae bacterium]|nr:hypothetical protein [Oscillospiraceae bacterium]